MRQEVEAYNQLLTVDLVRKKSALTLRRPLLPYEYSYKA